MNLFQNLANTLKGGGGAPAAPSSPLFSETVSAPSWDTLLSAAKETEMGIKLTAQKELREKGLGPTHTDNKVRLFGAKSEDEIRVVLYRDSAAWCPYCQKVWLLLEEKQIPFRIEKINMRSYGDKPEWFLQKVPRGLLPAIELDGRFESAYVHTARFTSALPCPLLLTPSLTSRNNRPHGHQSQPLPPIAAAEPEPPASRLITESIVIMQILDETFPEVPARQTHAARTLHACRMLPGWSSEP